MIPTKNINDFEKAKAYFELVSTVNKFDNMNQYLNTSNRDEDALSQSLERVVKARIKKNTPDNKVMLFSQYYKQHVLVHIGNKYHKNNPYVLRSLLWDHVENYALYLKPVSEISDEHKIEVIKVAVNSNSLTEKIKLTNSTKKHFGFSFILSDGVEYSIDLEAFSNPTMVCLNGKEDNQRYMDNLLRIYDYLRSKGYALPWSDVTVEEAVYLGWIILSSDEKTSNDI